MAEVKASSFHRVGSHFCTEDRRKPRRFRAHSEEIIFPSPFSLSKKTEFT